MDLDEAVDMRGGAKNVPPQPQRGGNLTAQGIAALKERNKGGAE